MEILLNLIHISRGQTLFFLPCKINTLQKQKVAISSTPNSAKIRIGDDKFSFIFIFIWK